MEDKDKAVKLEYHSFTRDLLFFAEEYGIHSVTYNQEDNIWTVVVGNILPGETITKHIYCLED